MKKPAKKSKAKFTKVTKAKTPKTRKATGLGDPNAKKTVNPQATLDLKKVKVREIGGKMVFAGRKWIITLKDGHKVEFASRELAALTVDKLLASINP